MAYPQQVNNYIPKTSRSRHIENKSLL